MPKARGGPGVGKCPIPGHAKFANARSHSRAARSDKEGNVPQCPGVGVQLDLTDAYMFKYK